MATGFQSLAYYFQTYGVLDFLLPFVLVFTIIFAILQKTPIFDSDPKKAKNFNLIIALVLALLFVVPHVTGSYPTGYDPVQILNESLPSISLLAIAAIMLLMLLGTFGSGFKSPVGTGIIAIIFVAFVVYIFGSALNWWSAPGDVFGWWTQEVTELLIIIAVFGLIVRFITKEPGEKTEIGKSAKDLINEIFN